MSKLETQGKNSKLKVKTRKVGTFRIPGCRKSVQKKACAKLKDIWINSRASRLISIILHLKLKDFLSKLKYFSAKLKDQR